MFLLASVVTTALHQKSITTSPRTRIALNTLPFARGISIGTVRPLPIRRCSFAHSLTPRSPSDASASPHILN
jgi:hypothetical protein